VDVKSEEPQQHPLAGRSEHVLQPEFDERACWSAVISSGILSLMSASEPSQARLLELPADLACQVWQEIDSSTACYNLMATSKGIQALMGPAVWSLEVTLTKPSDSPFRGLHPSIQPQHLTVKAAPPVDEADTEDHMGSDWRLHCDPRLHQFILSCKDSQHLRRLHTLRLVVGS
jgi:hypothetical protein